jgi:hypothetical protein
MGNDGLAGHAKEQFILPPTGAPATGDENSYIHLTT